MESLQHLNRTRLWTVQCLLGCVLSLAFISPALCQVKVGGKAASEIFPDPQVAALANAAASGNVLEVKRMVKAGVAVDGLGDRGATPLLFAMLARNPKGMEALLEAGANPNHRLHDTGYVGGLPLPMLLARSEAVDLMEVLLKHGADVETRWPVRTDQAKKFPYKGDTLLIEAVMHEPMVKLLVKHGAKVNFRPQWGDTAAVSAARLGQLDILEFLIAHGASDFTQIANSLQHRRWSEESRPRVIKILRDLHAKGAVIYHSDNNHDTPADIITPGKYKYQIYEGEQPAM